MTPGLSPDQVRDLVLSVGTHQSVRVLNPVEVAQHFQRALDAGVQRRELADLCLLDTTTIIGRFLRLLNLTPKLHHLVVFGSGRESLSFTQAMEIARIPDLEVQLQFAKLVLEEGLTKGEVAAVCQKLERSDLTVGEAAAEILQLRPAIERTVVSVGVIEGDTVRKFLSGMLQAERDTLFAEVLAEVGFSGTGHLAARRFTVSAPSASEATLDIDELEALVNECLTNRIS